MTYFFQTFIKSKGHHPMAHIKVTLVRETESKGICASQERLDKMLLETLCVRPQNAKGGGTERTSVDQVLLCSRASLGSH